jgi:hypothetical protein
MASATTRFLDIVMHRTNSAHSPGGTCDVTLQAGWTVFNMDAIERMDGRVLRTSLDRLYENGATIKIASGSESGNCRRQSKTS